MKKIILIACIFLTPQVNAGWFFELGIGLTKNEWSRPEVDLQSPLGRAVIGVEAEHGWRMQFEHTSSIPQDETGNGLNGIWFIKRVDF